MDIESDDSERWEDFFGSSTDLTPSLLGLYDTLTDSFEINSPQKRQRSLPELNEADEDREDDDSLTIEEDTSSKSSFSTESDVDRSSKNRRLERSNKPRSNIRILSPNVQRLILHSDVEVVEKVDIDAIQQQPITDSPQPALRFIKKPIAKHQVKLSHIPLSRNTSKLTQSGNELVDTFDLSNECLDTVSSKKHLQTPVAFDNDKTPTNANFEAFNFEIATPRKIKAVISPLAHEIEELIEVDKVMDLAALYDSDKNSEMNDVIEAFNYSVRTSASSTSTIVETTTESLSESVQSTETVKPSPILVRKSTPQSSPLLTYARVKAKAANKANSSTPISSPLSKTSNNGQCKTSMECLTERLNDMKSKFSPKDSRKIGLMLPDIAKLKHRPLSSSSICSTSSSSSSGSEHLNGKLATSYLASVESLADQSENELDTHHNGSYSVFERACMEFVDSERSYVEDLGQVIRGYLEDWRERACLRTTDLATLFSNIEEIYEFNSTLLKQLINSGMDPVKIAKCFINLRERFDVYTTYCTSYPEAISLLTSLLQATHTNALLTSTQKMLQHTLPLGSYLLKPVQRILKYHLLLDNLRKHCDIKEVSQAHQIMREVARNIDQVKRKLEQQSRVKELSGILDGWLGPELTVLGELRQEGLLIEHGKPRMVFLFDTMLIITKPKEDSRLAFKSYIHQNNLMLNEHLPGEPTSFYVIPYDEPRSQIKLTAKNRDQKRLWAQHIKGVILEKFDNIPNRAKELVYKLGDEEDRTPDTNKWKWSLNNAKPIYLERRNEYRRSEIRNRSKIKRKTSVTSSTSFEGFNDLNHRSVSRNHSMDDNMMPSLPRISSTNQSPQEDAECCDKAPDCHCITRNPSFSNSALNKFNKERSKSVPRISFIAVETDEEQMSPSGTLDNRKSKSTKSVEIKMYNTKTIPKRIATLKKNRSKKETSTFYMDLNEFEETVLKITESTEDLCVQLNKAEEALPDENRIQEEEDPMDLSNDLTTKEDAQIILDLLKTSREFERIYKKHQKKKSLESSSQLNSPEAMTIKEEVPPRPPSHSPPPLEVEEKIVPNPVDEGNEPIYETLLRNVHVPYKFSPILNRSKSQQYYQLREKKSSPTKRPDSDYVTLVYSASGNLQKIGDDIVEGISSGGQHHSSDSKINYETIRTPIITDTPAPTLASSSGNISQPEAIYARPIPKNFVKRLLGNSKAENVSASENSLVPRIRKSVDTVSLNFGKTNKPPERRVSDVTEMCRASIIHRQGCEALGERMAHVDYADPKTLFTNGSINDSVASLNLQRDSVFSLTSSNDSVCDSKKKLELPTSFEYEDDLEACLENDFRDSAIYSDDNDKRHDFGDSSTGDDYSHCPNSPPPLPPPRKTGNSSTSPLKGPTGISNPAVIMGPPHMSSSASRSWVLQQIENFSK